MKTPGSRKWSLSRIRSPRSAPLVNGLDGSTETTPTVSRASARARRARRRATTCRRPAGPSRRRRPRARSRGRARGRGKRERIAVLDERDRPRERAAIALPHARGQLFERPLLPRHASPLYAAPATPPGEPARAYVIGALRRRGGARSPRGGSRSARARAPRSRRVRPREPASAPARVVARAPAPGSAGDPGRSARRRS